MPIFTKILFPVDLTETSGKISPHVLEIADKFDAEVQIIFVVDIAQYVNIGLSYAFMKGVEIEVINSVEKKLSEFLEAEFKGKPVTSKVITGHPGEEILKYANSEGMELIVMGHSRSGMERIIFGSVTAHVVRHSDIPVLVIKGK
jgi:nucleotide-binding universal stress UspA family protein